jgi:hypothetical protein
MSRRLQTAELISSPDKCSIEGAGDRKSKILSRA